MVNCVQLDLRQGPNGDGASAADRWALSVLRVSGAASDPKTLARWGNLTNCARGTLRMHCYAAGLSPRASLHFARLLRLVTLSQCQSWDPAAWLDVADLRTLRRLLLRGGLPLRGSECPTVEHYVAHQPLIPEESAALRALQRRLGIDR